MRVNHTIIIKPIGVDGIIVYDKKRAKGSSPQQMNKISIIASFSRNRKTRTTIKSRPLVPGVNDRMSLQMNKGGLRYMTLWDDDVDYPEHELIFDTNLHTKSRRNRTLEPKEYEVVVGLKRGNSTVVLGVSLVHVYGPQREVEMDLTLCPVGFEDVQKFDYPEENAGVFSFSRDKANELGVAWDVDNVKFVDDTAREYVLAKNAIFKVRIEVVDTMSYEKRKFHEFATQQSNNHPMHRIRNASNYQNDYDYYDDGPNSNFNPGRSLADQISEISSVSEYTNAQGSFGIMMNTAGQLQSPKNPPQNNDMNSIAESRGGTLTIFDDGMTHPYAKNIGSEFSIDNGRLRDGNFTEENNVETMGHYNDFSFRRNELESRLQEQAEAYDDFVIGRSRNDMDNMNGSVIYDDDYGHDRHSYMHAKQNTPYGVQGDGSYALQNQGVVSNNSHYLHAQQPNGSSFMHDPRLVHGGNNGFMDASYDEGIQPPSAPFMNDDAFIDPNYFHNNYDNGNEPVQIDGMSRLEPVRRRRSRPKNRQRLRSIRNKDEDDDDDDEVDSGDQSKEETPFSKLFNGLFGEEEQSPSPSKSDESDDSSSSSSSSSEIEDRPLPQSLQLGNVSLAGQTELTNFTQDSYEKFEKPNLLPTTFGGNGMTRPSNRERLTSYLPSEEEYRSVGKIMNTRSRSVRRPQNMSRPLPMMMESRDDSNYESVVEGLSTEFRDNHSAYSAYYSDVEPIYNARSGRRR